MGTTGERPDAWEVLRAEYRRLREPPEVPSWFQDALRSRWWALPTVVAVVAALVALTWWQATPLVAGPATLTGLWVVGKVARRPPSTRPHARWTAAGGRRRATTGRHDARR